MANLSEAEPPPPVASEPHLKLPLESVSIVSQLVRVEIVKPCDDSTRPARVEVAVVLRRLLEIPPAKVEVAVVVASKTAAVVVPTTERVLYGEVVPIPTLPNLSTIN